MKRFLAALLMGVIFITTAPALSPDRLITTQFDFDDDPALMAEVVKAVNEVAIAHPEVRGALVRTANMPEGAYAGAGPGMIAINDKYASSRELVQAMLDADVAVGFHPPLGHCTAGQFLAYHEAAHLIDYAREQAPRKELKRVFGSGGTLREYLPGYSFSMFGLNAGEALAEAFAAVQCNGGNTVERYLYRLLVD